MHEGGFFYQALVYLAAAVISVPIAKRIGLGSVLGYLLAGIIIGPFGLTLIGSEGESVMHFAEFGVVMMLFLIGLELEPSLLWKLRVPILGLGASQVLGTTILIAIIGLIFGISWQMSIAIGLTLALSSTAIAMQSLNEKNLTKTEGGQSTFSVLLFQDIAVIPILAFMPLLAMIEVSSPTTPKHHTLIDGLPVWLQTISVLGIIASIVIVGKFLIGPIFRFIAKSGLREIFTAAALLLVVGIAIIMTQVGLSPALGTFMAGVVLAQSEYRHELETDIEPFKGLLLGLFFIAVGASIDFKLIADDPLLISLLVIALILIKFIVLFVVGKVFNMKMDNNFLFTFTLAQGGEFAFVLFSFAVQNNVITDEISAPLVAVVALTMALSPLIMLINEKLIQPRFGTKEDSKRDEDQIDVDNSVIIAGFGRVGSVIGRFLQANGIHATYLDINPDNVDFLRKLGLKVFYGDASRFDLLKAAGASKAKLLIVAVDQSEKGIEIVETAQKHFPQLKILARSNGWKDAYDYMDLGIEKVYRETFDTSMTIGIETLNQLGFRSYQVNRTAKKFKKRDQKALEKFAKSRKENPDHLKSVKQHFKELEQLMLEEENRLHKDKDIGWDAESIIQDFKKMIKE